MHARHLRVVAQEPPGPVFVVDRTVWTEPGTPYVVAACVDGDVLGPWTDGGQERYDRAGMERDPPLRAALAAWDRGDDGVCRRERRVWEGLVGRWSTARREAMRHHPSIAGRTPAPVR